MSKILESVDFSSLIEMVEGALDESDFAAEDVADVKETFTLLCMANFDCYQANMRILEIRRNNPEDYKGIADAEWTARSVGEARVFSKHEINNIIFDAFSNRALNPEADSQIYKGDDIVYPVGEMLDRLSIEWIKRADFRLNSRDDYAIEDSINWSNVVWNKFKDKLVEVQARQSYYFNKERRTYKLEGIKALNSQTDSLYRSVIMRRLVRESEILGLYDD